MQPEIPALFALGVVSGSTVCAMSCLPVLGPFIMGSARGGVHGTQSFFSFGAGKIIGYSILGVIAAFLGKSVPVEIQNYLRPLSALAIIAAGVSVLVVKKGGCACAKGNLAGLSSLFSYGLASSFLPCPALAAIMLSVAGTAKPLLGALAGAAFATGILVSPVLIVVCGGLGYASGKIQQESRGVGKVVACVSFFLLIISGIRIFLIEV